MEPKKHPRIHVFLARFWNGSGNIGGTAGGLRRGHFLQRIPQGGPRACGVIKQKQAKRDGLEDLTRLGPLARRIFIVFPLPLFVGTLGNVIQLKCI